VVVVGVASGPHNPQQTVREHGFPRTTPPSPGEEGTEEAPNKTRVREIRSRTRVFLGEGIKTGEERKGIYVLLRGEDQETPLIALKLPRTGLLWVESPPISSLR
jgi:hypothetical protein